jgi:hypothetical protein
MGCPLAARSKVFCRFTEVSGIRVGGNSDGEQGRFLPMAGARFDEVLASRLPINPRLPMTGLEQADSIWRVPQPVVDITEPEKKQPSTG